MGNTAIVMREPSDMSSLCGIFLVFSRISVEIRDKRESATV